MKWSDVRRWWLCIYGAPFFVTADRPRAERSPWMYRPYGMPDEGLYALSWKGIVDGVRGQFQRLA